MTNFIGKKAPDFTAKAIMPDNSTEHSFNLKEYLNGHKGIVFFYPLNFTFVCPSEIIALNNKLSEFTAVYTKIVAVSIDSHYSHYAWKNTAYDKGGIGNVQFPLVSDLTKEISTAYNVLHEDGMSLRGSFLIDDEFIIRHYVVNDFPLGRNINESLRMVDALNYYLDYGEVCPAGWIKGTEAINPTQEGIAEYLNANAKKL
ncbi:peroxiredoxin [Rickettsia endosymbiont of Cardiosporidium cionae]|uniref:peroxiredoxin n=1 Tax=Rickettsia endosymbiont of Cardiosporidium cionae TaxID=2777155 RepID=UPI001894C5D7|nr:peroxiredoxin [Rickettsia endosymbiont of Cardiosporidium cionae]KAF8818814.1 peroxiredoxin [Rickettsia endosymbiont of Cardiosporidium cionae]